jgi:hypothetical protein
VDGTHRVGDRVGPVAHAQLEHAPLGDLEARRERRQVAERLVGEPAVRGDDRGEVAVELAAARHADERELQPLLEDLDGVRRP